jgi:hypothetical protein
MASPAGSDDEREPPSQNAASPRSPPKLTALSRTWQSVFDQDFRLWCKAAAPVDVLVTGRGFRNWTPRWPPAFCGAVNFEDADMFRRLWSRMMFDAHRGSGCDKCFPPEVKKKVHKVEVVTLVCEALAKVPDFAHLFAEATHKSVLERLKSGFWLDVMPGQHGFQSKKPGSCTPRRAPRPRARRAPEPWVPAPCAADEAEVAQLLRELSVQDADAMAAWLAGASVGITARDLRALPLDSLQRCCDKMPSLAWGARLMAALRKDREEAVAAAAESKENKKM